MRKKGKNMKTKTKYIFVSGGVLSGVGKGITAASIGAILKAKGFKVSIQKCDPYLNVDAGLLSPAEHGECFVTKDGAETDLDLGHYERFLDEETTKNSTTLSGALFRDLIEKERAGGFKGQTVQMVPHLTGAIHEAIERAGRGSDVHICEIGGTVGDYESLSFIEAIRSFAGIVGRRNCLYVSVVYAPFLNTSKEFKTKPAQNALRDLRGFGIIPDIVAVRTDRAANGKTSEKIARFAGIEKDAVVLLPDVKSVYDVPINVLKSGVLNVLNDFMDDDTEPDMSVWAELSRRSNESHDKSVTVGLIAEYIDNDDVYLSITEALKAAALAEEVDLEIKWIYTETLSDEDFVGIDGILVPGDFGELGLEGKLKATTYALENDVPFMGICQGLQMAAVAAANLGGLKNATSEEIHPKSQKKVIYYTGATRLGDSLIKLENASLVKRIYGSNIATERHRHCYEVNKKFLPAIKKGSLVVSGTGFDGQTIEFVEAPSKKFFIATQAHPEYRSRPNRPHPLFLAFLKSTIKDQSSLADLLI